MYRKMKMKKMKKREEDEKCETKRRRDELDFARLSEARRGSHSRCPGCRQSISQSLSYRRDEDGDEDERGREGARDPCASRPCVVVILVVRVRDAQPATGRNRILSLSLTQE